MKLSIKRITALLAMAVFILIAGPAKADTVLSSTTNVYSVLLSASTESYLVSADLFDTNLGTLESVTITLSGVVTSSTVTIRNRVSGDNINGLLTTAVSLELDDSSAGYLADTKVVTSGSTIYITAIGYSPVNTGTGTATTGTTVDSSALSSWTTDGSGTTDLNLTAQYNTQVTGTDGSYSKSVTTVTGTATVTVTYNYVAAVPEPSTWAMIFGGVATLVVVQRVRRHRTV